MAVRTDTSVRAFRKYIRLSAGFDNMSYFDVCERLRRSCRCDSEALRLLAVYDTLITLRAQGKYECADAVSYVYFAEKGRVPRKNEVSFRVRRFAQKNCMDERTVWRRISEAKELYLAILEQKLITEKQ